MTAERTVQSGTTASRLLGICRQGARQGVKALDGSLHNRKQASETRRLQKMVRLLTCLSLLVKVPPPSEFSQFARSAPWLLTIQVPHLVLLRKSQYFITASPTV